MLKRLFLAMSRKIKKLTMAEAFAASEQECKTLSEKRPHDNLEKDECDVKKIKTETTSPVQGRPDRQRKVALLMAYCGVGYYGIQNQNNDEFKTIESELVKALLAAKVIPQEHAETPQKMFLQRASRTDKSVSAIGNVISLKMVLEENVVEKINSYLPPEIRIIDCIRTTHGFDSKYQCTSRIYKYIVPTYAFAPFEKFITKDYRVGAGLIERVNEVLALYIGTHNFHNFTSGRKPNDPSARRYIIQFECGEPFIQEGIEFAELTVKGQSFMLHHIRKMIGLMIAIMRGYCGVDVLEKAWGPYRVDIPKAPSLGLFLDKLFYDGYNKKFGNDGIHEPMSWEKYQDVLEKFKTEHILTPIVRAEKYRGVMLQWLSTLQCHKFDIDNPEMGVPPEDNKDPTWWRTRHFLKKLNKMKEQDAADSTMPIEQVANLLNEMDSTAPVIQIANTAAAVDSTTSVVQVASTPVEVHSTSSVARVAITPDEVDSTVTSGQVVNTEFTAEGIVQFASTDVTKESADFTDFTQKIPDSSIVSLHEAININEAQSPDSSQDQRDQEIASRQ